MGNVRIITDSISGITPELASQYGIRVVPGANFIIDGQTYADGEGLSVSEAYEMIDKYPDSFSTATLNPGYLLDIFREECKLSKELLFLNFSSALSAEYQVACMAADMLQKEMPEADIRVYDTHSVAAPQALLAITAARASDLGMSLDEIYDLVVKARPKTGGIMMLDTLKYVYRTGRFSKTTSRIASLLHIKPINRINDRGELEVVDKVRKRADGFQRLIEYIHKDVQTDALHFVVAHSSAPELAEEFIALLEKEFTCLSVAITEYSPLMGYAAGPKCIFVGYQPELEQFKNR